MSKGEEDQNLDKILFDRNLMKEIQNKQQVLFLTRSGINRAQTSQAEMKNLGLINEHSQFIGCSNVDDKQRIITALIEIDKKIQFKCIIDDRQDVHDHFINDISHLISPQFELMMPNCKPKDKKKAKESNRSGKKEVKSFSNTNNAFEYLLNKQQSKNYKTEDLKTNKDLAEDRENMKQVDKNQFDFKTQDKNNLVKSMKRISESIQKGIEYQKREVVICDIGNVLVGTDRTGMK